MSKEELIAKAQNEQVNFWGNVEVSKIWTGEDYLPYYAMYATKDGIHACQEGCEEFINDFDPIDFDEIADETYDLLCEDII
jgi:hypothetical protein